MFKIYESLRAAILMSDISGLTLGASIILGKGASAENIAVKQSIIIKNMGWGARVDEKGKGDGKGKQIRALV